jgi:hypothetical protein
VCTNIVEPPSGFALSIVALQWSTAKIEFHLGDVPQSRPIGRMPLPGPRRV